MTAHLHAELSDQSAVIAPTPSRRGAGIAGVLAGAGLAVETAGWSASGWTPQTFTDPATALQFLRDSGGILRVAVFVGAVNLVFTVVLLAGLAGWLRAAAPTRAATTLYCGVVGVAGHALVPLGLWLGAPAFTALAGRDAATAEGAWAGFNAVLAAAGAAGALFLGVAMLAAGSAALTSSAMPTPLGWVAALAGAASILTALAATTPLDSLASAAYLPSLGLAIVFRTWAGIHLWRVGPGHG
ncbi:hypothetical protein ACIA5D_50720 [Actinoplanes sp. NPDC051513]|uniref:hypothetical protein n=1 Tax=Actinoplanes sp. NPDC051513 TaxID=3363908 RepID=UPI0037B0BC9B